MLLNPNEALLNEVNAFLERTGFSPSRFGKDAIGDPNFVRHLRAGRDPRLSTVTRIREFMNSEAVA